MSGDLTARDVIAREFRAWDFDAVTPTTQADVVLAALAAAGWRLEHDDQWEWSNSIEFGNPYEPTSEDQARAFADRHGGRVVRRRPAGEWEVAPNA